VDPVEQAARAACELLPGVVVDGVGQALGRRVVVSDELALWDQGGVSPGLETIGAAGLGVIRANSTCQVTERETTAHGLRVTLQRQEPDLDKQATWEREEVQDLPAIARTVVLDVVDTPDGRRIRLGVDRARTELAAAAALAEKGQLPQAVEALDALVAWFPDPLLRWQRQAWTASLAPAPPPGSPAEPELPAELLTP
jgi:hypothetical protein